MFSSDDHSVAPCERFTIWYTFNDTERFIAHEVIIYLFLPVDGYSGWSMAGFRSCIGVNVNFYLRSLHTWQRLVGAGVECRRCLSRQKPFFHLAVVLRRAGKGQFGWSARCCFSVTMRT